MSDKTNKNDHDEFQAIGINGLEKIELSDSEVKKKEDKKKLDEFKGLYHKSKEEEKNDEFGMMTEKVDMPYEDDAFEQINTSHGDPESDEQFGKLTDKVDLPGGDEPFKVLYGKDPAAKEEPVIPDEEAQSDIVPPEPVEVPDFEELKEKARQEGFETGKKQGYEEGHREGLEAGRVEVQDALSHIKSLIIGLESAWEDMIAKNQEKIIGLISKMTHKILLKSLEFDNEAVKRSIIEAFTYITEPEDVTININPEDYDYIEASKDDFFNMFRSLKQVTVVATPSVNRGGCRLETQNGEIDTDIESRFEAVVHSIRKSAGLENE